MKYETLKGKVVIVTGAGSGLGRATAIGFAEQGAIVWCLGRTKKTLEETVSKSDSENVQYEICDISDFKSVSSVFEKITQKSGQIDILINNAATFGETAPIVDCDPEDWKSVIVNNVVGTFHCTKAVLPTMIKQHSGYIVNISSLATSFAYTERSAYSSSKSAIEYLTKVTAAENAQYNIIANAIAPGHINGERIDKVMVDRAKVTNVTPEEMKEKFLKQYKLGFVLDPEDVAEEILHLTGSSVGRKMTGEVVHIKCGFRL
jgi:3-oxoacyl-[acyl-carrier protein] reductase